MVGDKKQTVHGVKRKHVAAAKKPAAKQVSTIVTVDRRESRAGDRRSSTDRRVHQIPVAVERRVANAVRR